MSTQESRAIGELRRRNQTLFERVEQLKVVLDRQIKVDSGKASNLRNGRDLRSGGDSVGTHRGVH